MSTENYQNILETTALSKIYSAKLNEKEFRQLSSFISTETGIKMPPEKKVLLQNRLYKRLKNLNINSFKNYCDFVFSRQGRTEINHLIDVICTNKTSFYRESHHFDFLRNTIIPELQKQNQRKINIWSAGCSSGEEPYSIAMLLDYYKSFNKSAFDFNILGTDISTIMLEKSINAIYNLDRLNEIPFEIKSRYLLKNKNKEIKTFKICPLIRQKVSFKRLNLMNYSYDLKTKFDVIFCRNVLIYFERDIQEKVIKKLCYYLNEGGYLFIGHSESLFNMDLPLIQQKPTIFKKI